MLLTDSRSCQATDATAVVAFVASIVSSVTRKGALLTTDEFRRSLAGPQPPPGLSPALLALWHDGRGDWDDAHSVAQEVHSRDGSRVHAYLHRKEGDDANAHYWYRRAAVSPFQGGLDEEWTAIVADLLQGS